MYAWHVAWGQQRRNEFAFTLQQLLRSLNSKPKVRKLWQFSMKTWRQTIFSGHYHP